MTIAQENQTKKESIQKRIVEIKADVSRGKMSMENLDWMLETIEEYAELSDEKNNITF